MLLPIRQKNLFIQPQGEIPRFLLNNGDSDRVPDPGLDPALEETSPIKVKPVEEAAPPTSGMIIRANHVDYLYNPDLGVHDLNFQVPTGVIFGLVGPSGCGKTTTVRLLTGMHAPTAGELTVLGEKPSQFTGRTRENIGYMAQHQTLYPMLTVWENLNFVASLYGMGFLSRGKRLKSLLKFVELYDARNRLASKLSGGMQRRLQLACALAHGPQLLFADEPTAGIDPLLRSKFWEHFRSLRNEGHSLFITTQYIGEIEHCDVVGIMRAGRLLYVDTPEGLRRRAFGGDVVRLQVDQPQTPVTAQLLDSLKEVTDVRRSQSEPGLLYVSTNDAASAIPTLLAAIQEKNIEVRQAERYVPPFDDVFIELMRQSGGEND